ncbi:uncharacterized protein [Acropora muricata]|uniref:uncharacterized protein isoform X3 n=1 Tax=Acropora muricata TaxID=159855 RepID=UPI0034E536CB
MEFSLIVLGLLTYGHIGAVGLVSTSGGAGVKICDPNVENCNYYTGQVIYHQTMTPKYIREHASHINNEENPANSRQITFAPANPRFDKLLRIPLIPPGVFKSSAPITIQMTAANDVSLATGKDSDLQYGLSDGDNYIGFMLVDTKNYKDHAPCLGVEGKPGVRMGSHRTIEQSRPIVDKSETFYPGRFELTFKLNEHRGFCYTAHVGGYVKDATYSRQLDISKGLSLEVYADDDAGEKYGIRLITVSVIYEEETFQ